MTPTMLTSTPNPVESDPNRDVAFKAMEQQPELANKGMPLSMPLHTSVATPVRSDGIVAHTLQRPACDSQSAECPITSDTLNQQEELTIEAGTISISSVYSQGCVYSFHVLNYVVWSTQFILGFLSKVSTSLFSNVVVLVVRHFMVMKSCPSVLCCSFKMIDDNCIKVYGDLFLLT